MTIWLVRHAVAGVRNHADPNDDRRPLDQIGIAQAASIRDRLMSETIEAIYSSPALRCVETVTPLAAYLDLEIDLAAPLFEASSTSRSMEFIRSLTGRHVAMCSHGDVIPDVLRSLETGGSRIDGRGCAKGSIWRLDNSTERIETAQYLGPVRAPAPQL